MVFIPAGEFMMGSEEHDPEKPVHKVAISKPFYLGKYEVTQEQWQAVMGTNPSHLKGPKKPVGSVSWNDCQDFLRKLSEKTGHKFALPTEAQWEYACRAGSTSRFSFGDDENALKEYAWFDDNSGNTSHRVGEKKPNAWGLYDMHGNVWEWCQSLYKSYPYRPDDGREDLTSRAARALRPGSWYIDNADNFR
jgi:formylglycine-generating enzyme required for sulfatase activity